MNESFEYLFDEITRSADGNDIFFLRNSGNWGDSLIREGFEEFAAQYGLRYTIYDRSNLKRRRLFLGKYRNPLDAFSRKKRDVLIYGGGGAWCRNWDHGAAEVDLAARIFDRVIVLPSTYEIPPLRQYDNVLFFSRDRYRSLDVSPQSRFCHDMAFFLNDRISRMPVEKDRRIGCFFRRDAESSGAIPIPKGNVDISAQGNQDTPVERFLHEIGRCERVLTDRLHVAIAGSMLKCKVELYSGNYFKNEDIYKSSLLPYFDEFVRFVK